MSSEAQDMQRRIIEHLELLPFPITLVEPEKSASGCYEWHTLDGSDQVCSFYTAFDWALRFQHQRLRELQRVQAEVALLRTLVREYYAETVLGLNLELEPYEVCAQWEKRIAALQQRAERWVLDEEPEEWKKEGATAPSFPSPSP